MLHTHTHPQLKLIIWLKPPPGLKDLAGSLHPPVSTLAGGHFSLLPPFSTGHVWRPKQLGPGFLCFCMSMSLSLSVCACVRVCVSMSACITEGILVFVSMNLNADYSPKMLKTGYD